MSTNRERLIKLMTDNNLSCPDVGRMLNRKAHTVKLWRCSDNISDHTLELLEFKIAQARRVSA